MVLFIYLLIYLYKSYQRRSLHKLRMLYISLLAISQWKFSYLLFINPLEYDEYFGEALLLIFDLYKSETRATV